MLEIGKLNGIESPENISTQEATETVEPTESDTNKLENPPNSEISKLKKSPSDELEGKLDEKEKKNVDPDLVSKGEHTEQLEDPTNKLEKVKNVKDVDDGCLSTYKERLDQTPKDGDRGEWSGERGESQYIPSDEGMKKILAENGTDGIEYKNAIPNFSDVSKSTVKIDDMSDDRASNFKQCDEKCVDQWNQDKFGGKDDWTARDIANWRNDNKYSWHERNDMETCDLVPTEVNSYFGHLGGVSECKKRDDAGGGNEFDE